MKRILIVDDDADMRETLRFALEDQFEVSLASNGFEAIRRLEQGQFDAVLLDLSMPVLDGGGVIREMRRRRLAVPVVLLSAEIDLARIAGQLEIPEFLSKPVGLTELRRTLARATTATRRKVRARSVSRERC